MSIIAVVRTGSPKTRNCNLFSQEFLMFVGPQSGRISNFCRSLPGLDAGSQRDGCRCLQRVARMRAAIYTRVSTRDRGQDTANQLNQLRDACRARSWEVVAEYEDHDTGSKPDRTQFQALMRDAVRRKFDVVLFWALDRFTREGARETLNHLNTLTTYDVVSVPVKNGAISAGVSRNQRDQVGAE